VQAYWSGRITNAAMRWAILAFFLLVIAIVFVANETATADKQMPPSEFAIFISLMLAATIVSFGVTDIRANIYQDAFTVSFGPWGWPTKRIDWQDVVKVESLTVRPTQWGGWGYRWIPFTKGIAVVLRKGPGLKFELTHNRVFVVTVDDVDMAMVAIRRVMDELPPDN
jgi:hypothetical protein